MTKFDQIRPNSTKFGFRYGGSDTYTTIAAHIAYMSKLSPVFGGSGGGGGGGNGSLPPQYIFTTLPNARQLRHYFRTDFHVVPSSMPPLTRAVQCAPLRAVLIDWMLIGC